MNGRKASALQVNEAVWTSQAAMTSMPLRLGSGQLLEADLRILLRPAVAYAGLTLTAPMGHPRLALLTPPSRSDVVVRTAVMEIAESRCS